MKHELTRKEKEQDRIRHFDVCNCHTEPVFLTYRHTDEIDSIISRWLKNHEPVYNFISEDQVGHKLWVVDDDKILDSLASAFEKLDKFILPTATIVLHLQLLWENCAESNIPIRKEMLPIIILWQQFFLIVICRLWHTIAWFISLRKSPRNNSGGD